MRWILIAFSILSVSLAAQEMARVLLPVTVLDVPGAHGSLWRSELWAHIRVDGVTIIPLRVADAQPLPAGSRMLPVFLRHAGEPPGQFIEVTRALLDDVSLNLRVRDLSRAAETWGTEIPVVRESDFRSGEISLLPLALEPGFRNTLRVYAAGEGGGDVRIRISVVEDGTNEERLAHDSIRTLAPTGSPWLPSYLELALEGLAGGVAGGVARVDIAPATEGLRIWAFVSTTDNETQHFTTLSPQ